MDEKKDLRYDGYVNLLTKAGTWKDSTEAYTYQFEDPTPDTDLAQMYSTNGLFTRIIDKPAELAFKYGYNLGMSDPDIEERTTKQLERLKWKANGSLALKWARLFGGSAILLGVDDGMDWEEPIDEDNVRGVENLVVFERPEIQPDYLSTIYRKISPKNMDQFGQPEYYYITPVYGGQQIRVHESRLLIFKNCQLPRTSTMSTGYMFFGSPEYNRIKRELRDTVTTHGNGYRMLERCVQAVYKMKNLSALLATEEGEEDVLKRIELVDMARSLLNTMVIDGDGEEFQFQSFSLPGIRDIIDESCNMLSAVTNIPQTVLFGRSPAGENATGESDLTNYYDYVGLIQEMNVTDNLTKLVKLILRGYANTGKIDDVPSFELEANPLWNMSEMEKAQLDQAQASAAATKASTAATYIQLQVLDPREVRKSLAESDEFKIDDVISEDDLVSDEEWEKMMQQSQQQGAQPGQQPQQPAAQPAQPQQPTPPMNQKDGRTHNDGGTGSGNWGHEGRPGNVGGSKPGGGIQNRINKENGGFTSNAKEKKKASESENATSKPASNEIPHNDITSTARSERSDELSDLDLSGKATLRRKMEDLSYEEIFEPGYTGEGSAAGTLARHYGLNQPPTIMEAGEFDNFVDETGAEVIYRGVDDFEPDDEEQDIIPGSVFVDEFAEDPSEKASYGGGNYGFGYHFGSEESSVLGFAGWNEENVIECAIKDDARIASWSEWTSLSDEDKGRYGYDAGFYALANGYDGISSDTGVTNIVNRGCLIMKDKSGKYKKDSVAKSSEKTSGIKKDDKGDLRHGVGVYVVNDGKLLCGTRADNGKTGGPGGHVKDGETLLQAAIRETQEEFGITPKELVWFGHLGKENGHSDSHLFLCTDWEGDLKTVDREMSKPRWASLEELEREDLYGAFGEGTERLIKVVTRADGNAGSGNWGHEGRPGKIGGSKPGAGKQNRISRATGEYTSKQREAKRKVVNGTDKTKTFTWDKDKYKYQIDSALAYQGYNGLPKVVDQDEFWEAVEESGFLGKRVYSADSQEVLDAYRKALYDGEFYVNCSNGGAAYGQGMYAAGDLTGGENTDYLNGVAQSYSRGESFTYTEDFTIDPSAKLVQLNDLRSEMREYRQSQENEYKMSCVDAVFEENDYGDDAEDLKTFVKGYISGASYGSETYSKMEEIAEKVDPDVRYAVMSAANSKIGEGYAEFSKSQINYNDTSSFAALRGYDGVIAGRLTGYNDDTSYVVMLNRTKLIFLSPQEERIA